MPVADKRTYLITSETARSGALMDIRSMPLSDKAVVEIKPHGVTRSLRQNKLSFLWYREIGQQTGQSTREARRECKRAFGLPILFDDDDALAEWWDRIAADMDYETQLESMDWIEVTRRFTTRQFALYLDEIETFYAPKGIRLSRPDDLYMDALMRDAE